MDYKRLVEDGTYSKDNLNPIQKAYVGGLECAKETVENYKANYDSHLSCDVPMLVQLVDEIAEKLIDGLCEYLDSDIAEAIVSFEDSNICEKEGKGGVDNG